MWWGKCTDPLKLELQVVVSLAYLDARNQIQVLHKSSVHS